MSNLQMRQAAEDYLLRVCTVFGWSIGMNVVSVTCALHLHIHWQPPVNKLS